MTREKEEQQKSVFPSLEATSLKSRFWQGPVLPLKHIGQNPSLPLPSFWWFAGDCWHFLACSCSIWISAWQGSRKASSSPISSLCVPLLFLSRTLECQISTHPTQIWPHFNLTSDTCNDPVSRGGHILRYWGLRLQHLFGGDAIQPITTQIKWNSSFMN